MTRKENWIAALVLALFVPGLAALFWGTQQRGAVEQPGPLRSFTHAGAAHAAIFFNGALHLLDAEGRPLARQPLRELGLAEEPTDMDWTAGPDGRLQAWFFEDTAPRLVRCDLQPEPLRLRDCAQVLAGGQLKVNAASRAVHFTVDAARERVFIADAKGHAVRALSLRGELLGDSAAGELYFPNRLRLVGDSLVVADNDNHRVVWLDVAQARPSFRPQRSVSLGSHPQAAGGRKAADFAFVPGPDGAPPVLWVLAVGQGQKHGRLVAFDSAQSARGAADQGGHADPLIIDRFGASVLAADFDGIAYFRVAADGRFLGSFGQGAFAEELARERGRLRTGQAWVHAGWAAMAAAMLAGFVLAWRHGQKPGAAQAQAAFASWSLVTPEMPAQPVLLEPAAWYRRQLLWVTLLPLLGLVGVVAAFGPLFRHQLPPSMVLSGRVLVLVAGAVVALLALAGILWATWRTGRRALWITAGRVEVRTGDNIQASCELAQVLASAQALLIGDAAVPYRGIGLSGQPGRWIYDEWDLTRYVLAHLGPQQQLAPPAMARATLRRLPLWQQVAIGVPFVLYAGYTLWQLLR